MKKRVSRFEQLHETALLQAKGNPGNLIVTGRMRSYTGSDRLVPMFEVQVSKFSVLLSKFASGEELLHALVLLFNEREITSKRGFESIGSNLKNGLIRFAEIRGLAPVPIKSWPCRLAQDFISWLRTDANHSNSKGGKVPRSENTARKYYADFHGLLDQFNRDPNLKVHLPELEYFPINPFSGAQNETVRTRTLGLASLIQIMNAARQDLLESREKFYYAQQLFAGERVMPEFAKKGMAAYRNLNSVLWALKDKYPGVLPPFTSLLKSDRAIFNAINRLHGGSRKVWPYLQPDGAGLIPPMLLLTVFAHSNTEALRSLELTNVFESEVLTHQRLLVRAVIRMDKTRAQPILRSFAVDKSDPLSPSSIFEFMGEWTESIRKDAGDFSNYVFIFGANSKVRSFNTARQSAKSGDSVWTFSLREFQKTHGLPAFSLSELRQTALDAGRMILDDDPRAVAALGGWLSKWVMDFHYKSDGARLRMDGQIAFLQGTMERWVATSGAIGHQGAESKQDALSATPGWLCLDPYDSPIPGETKGRLCSAFGQCPNCPQGSTNLSSRYSLGRTLQLRDELKLARSYLPTERWVNVFCHIQTVLEKVWLPSFPTETWEKVKATTLPPIGRLE